MNFHIRFISDQSGERLDSLVCRLKEGLSRSLAVSQIQSGNIQVNHTIKKPGYRVKTGDLITGRLPEIQPPVIARPEAIPVEIVFEDDHILVIHKPSGMVVHPGPGNLSGTLVNALGYIHPSILNVGEERLRSGIVHRLDKDTSGLMVIARTDQALDFLKKEFKQRRVEKKYLGLVTGSLPDDQGIIDLPIGRHPVKRTLMAVRPDGGKPALTIWKVIRRFGTACLLEITLKTGRTHQIRVHFYTLGHPLVGDRVYQTTRARKKKGPFPRQMLHAFSLSFRHPYSGRRMTFTAEPPADFSDAQIFLGGHE